MPKYNFIISQAIDLVTQILSGMKPEMLVDFTQILCEEAQRICKEFQTNGQNINLDILAAKLDEFATRMKYEFHNKDPESSPYQFPIFNVSHNLNPSAYLYDKHYKEASSIFEPKTEPITTTNSTSSSYPIYSQQPIIDWYFINPYATYYQDTSTHHLPHSSTGDDLHLYSTIDSELNYSTNANTQKIVVNVIKDNLSSTNSQTHFNSSKSIPKSNNNEIITKKGIYTSPNTIIGSQTMEDLFEVVKNQKSSSSQSKSMIDRVIIIDRHDSNAPNNNQTNNEKERLHTFEMHTSIPMITTTISITPSTGYMVQQPTYYNPQQLIYQQPEMYTSMPSNIYLTTTTTSYVANANSHYPFVYYQY